VIGVRKSICTLPIGAIFLFLKIWLVNQQKGMPMDCHQQLQRILDTHPSGAPDTEIFRKILKILFSCEEAAVAIHMNFAPKSPEVIAAAADLTVGEILPILEAMADKGIIMSREKDGRKSYALLPTIPGLFEFPLMRGERTPQAERLGKLWVAYHAAGMGAAFAGNPTPMSRVIPVEQALDTSTRIHPYEEVARIIAEADELAVAHCACRVSVGRCDKPKEVCLIFGPMARFLVGRRFARAIDRKEALRILRESERAGLVHTSNNSADRAGLICNCCRCCCTILRGRTELHHPHAFSPSGFHAVLKDNTCNGCGICADERCPMEAITIGNDVARIDPEKCIGCGLCVTACPTEALSMIRRETIPDVPATGREMAVRVLTEKGKLEKFIEATK